MLDPTTGMTSRSLNNFFLKGVGILLVQMATVGQVFSSIFQLLLGPISFTH